MTNFRIELLDALDAREFNRIPFAGSSYTDSRTQWIADTNVYLEHLKNSFWYAWHKYASKVEVAYGSASNMWEWQQTFDIVLAGAIVEHISDPIPFIANLAALSNDYVILAFTPVLPDEEMIIRPIVDWQNKEFNYSWWQISLGIYKHLFENLGFSVELMPSRSLCNEYSPPLLIDRPTVVARRRR